MFSSGVIQLGGTIFSTHIGWSLVSELQRTFIGDLHALCTAQ